MNAKEKLAKFSLWLGDRYISDETHQKYLWAAKRILEGSDCDNAFNRTIRHHLDKAGISASISIEDEPDDLQSMLTPEQRIRHSAINELARRIPTMEVTELVALAGLEE